MILRFCSEKIYLSFRVPMFCLNICMCAPEMTGAQRPEKGIGFPELEIRMVVNHHLGAGTNSVSFSGAASVSHLSGPQSLGL